MLAKDIIKIKYSNEGYLPDYPPHLISDEEMCEAFILKHQPDPRYESVEDVFQYFYDTYPLLDESLEEEYNNLINALRYHMCRFTSNDEFWYQDMPDWVYSYMLGEVVTQSSETEDKHFLLTGIGLDNIEDRITPQIQGRCYDIMNKYVASLPRDKKQIKVESELKALKNSLSMREGGLERYDTIEANVNEALERWEVKADRWGYIVTRPPSMFGEQIIIKLIRTNGAVN